jgi:hypothetical protein
MTTRAPGIQDPTVEHLTKWEFLGPLFKAKANYSWDDDQGWSGNFGVREDPKTMSYI